MIIRIINNTKIDFKTLLKHYVNELNPIEQKDIATIVFDPSTMIVFGVDQSILLEVRD